MKKLVNFNDYKLYEFEESKDILLPDRVVFMDKLNKEVKELLKEIPGDFKVKYARGKLLTIGTERKGDLRITINVTGDMVIFTAFPTEGPSFEFNYGFSRSDVDKMVSLIKKTIETDPNQGILPEPKGKTYKYDTSKQSKTVKEEEIEPLNKPITKKPIRRKRSIDINVIQDVLEDAYILDDIDLKNTSVEELVRRMLLETRKK